MKENEQNFDELKKLLKLKQHEIPPPGYFNNFSDKVIARIQAGEAADSSRLESHGSWLAQLFSIFQAKPSVLAGSATALCLLLVLGVMLTEKAENATAGLMANTQTPQDLSPMSMPLSAVDSQLLADGGTGIQISTNPISLQPAANLFGQQNPLIRLQTASFAH